MSAERAAKPSWWPAAASFEALWLAREVVYWIYRNNGHNMPLQHRCSALYAHLQDHVHRRYRAGQDVVDYDEIDRILEALRNARCP